MTIEGIASINGEIGPIQEMPLQVWGNTAITKKRAVRTRQHSLHARCIVRVCVSKALRRGFENRTKTPSGDSHER